MDGNRDVTEEFSAAGRRQPRTVTGTELGTTAGSDTPGMVDRCNRQQARGSQPGNGNLPAGGFLFQAESRAD